jgi:hypothetical protein
MIVVCLQEIKVMITLEKLCSKMHSKAGSVAQC